MIETQKTFRKVGSYVSLFKPDNCPAHAFEVGILRLIKSLAFEKRMPVSAVGFNHNLELGQGKVTGILPDTIFRLVKQMQGSQRITDYAFNRTRTVTMGLDPSTKTSARTKTELLQFSLFHINLFVTPFTRFKNTLKQRMMKTTDCPLVSIFASTTTIFSSFPTMRYVKRFMTRLAKQMQWLYFVPRRDSLTSFVCLDDIGSCCWIRAASKDKSGLTSTGTKPTSAGSNSPSFSKKDLPALFAYHFYIWCASCRPRLVRGIVAGFRAILLFAQTLITFLAYKWFTTSQTVKFNSHNVIIAYNMGGV